VWHRIILTYGNTSLVVGLCKLITPMLHIEELVCTKEKKILSSSEFLDVVKNIKDLFMNFSKNKHTVQSNTCEHSSKCGTDKNYTTR
jgi:hypothetical protein